MKVCEQDKFQLHVKSQIKKVLNVSLLRNEAPNCGKPIHDEHIIT